LGGAPAPRGTKSKKDLDRLRIFSMDPFAVPSRVCMIEIAKEYRCPFSSEAPVASVLGMV
jgi:hypothetical protein